MNILVLCTGNSARSILLETILRVRGEGRVRAFSAGSRPVGRVNPAALALLAERGHSLHGLRSKSWDEFAAADAPVMDLIVTVCGNAADEACPVWPGQPLIAHWGIDDPAATTAPDSAVRAAFAQAYALLDDCAARFFAGSPERLSRDALAAHVAGIEPDVRLAESVGTAA